MDPPVFSDLVADNYLSKVFEFGSAFRLLAPSRVKSVRPKNNFRRSGCWEPIRLKHRITG
jgi:hypothetical protein